MIVSIDVSTLSGWANVSAGTHTLGIIAKANGYQDSNVAMASITKAATFGITNKLAGATTSSYQYTFIGVPTRFKVNNGAWQTADWSELIVNPPEEALQSEPSYCTIKLDGTVICDLNIEYRYAPEGSIPINVVYSDGTNEDSDYFDAQGAASGECYAKGTLITLSDGSTKAVENISYNDDLTVWDYDDGCLGTAKPAWIRKAATATYYYLITLSSGGTIKLVGSDGNCHRLYSVQDNKFVYANELVGKPVYTQNGIETVVSCVKIDGTVIYYNIITAYHFNCFANGILTSCRLNNLYPIKNMKYVKDNRAIVSNDTLQLPDKYYTGVRAGEQNPDTVVSYINHLIPIALPKK